ncbi:hypothetical protein [Streptomyces sp. AcE210]|uniref:hypothetical protein n=1 Tax=Streptomyces sp. AcE210 TaxID=2292703 RepID=UPI001404C6AC|nr:hypothetical protein [Streptomyces sp. AcE210]
MERIVDEPEWPHSSAERMNSRRAVRCGQVRLAISQRTADAHVEHILAKLGVASR